MLGPNRDMEGRGLPVPSRVTRIGEGATEPFGGCCPAARIATAAPWSPVARARASRSNERAEAIGSRRISFIGGCMPRILEHQEFSRRRIMAIRIARAEL